MQSKQAAPKSVAVYSPDLQGFYFGEMIGQLQQLCKMKRYRFALICTRSFGKYCSMLGIERFDIVILLRNAVHPDLVAEMQERGSAVVSIGFDYFPLNVPVVTCDNAYGVELAFDHLLKAGHQRLAFIGDISIFDIRKRFEAYSELHERHQMALQEDDVFLTDNPLVSGGFAAAKRFIDSGCDATGILCGAGLTAIGFEERLTELDAELLASLDLVAFDATSLMPVCAPNCVLVDQNLFLLTHKALGIGEKIFNNETVERHETVQPKLIDPGAELYDSDQAFLATSTELPELHDANYMKSVISHFYEWVREIAKSKFEDIIMLHSLFPRYVHSVLLTRLLENPDHGEVSKVLRHINLDGSETFNREDKKSLARAISYPKALGRFHPASFDSEIHIPICNKGRSWGVLSVFGQYTSDNQPASLIALSGFLCLVADYFQLEIAKANSTTQFVEAQNAHTEGEYGVVTWNLDDQSCHWSEAALAMLGYVTALEQQVYQHMDILDRIHEEDEPYLQQLVQRVTEEHVQTTLRLRQKDRAYQAYYIQCRAEGRNGFLTLHLYKSLSEDE